MSASMRREFLVQLSALSALGSTAIAAQPTDAPSGPFGQIDAERTAGVTPTHLQFEPGDVRRYGADPSGNMDSTKAFIDANAVGSTGGCSVRVAAGRYKYSPSATLNVAASWYGDGAHGTIIFCDNSKFSGEFFRMIGSSDMSDLFFKATSGKKGTCLRLAPADAAQFTGHVRLTRVWTIGFNYNIQCDNNFEVTFDQVRSAEGNEGFYCAPETGGGNGYCTSHLHLNCYYGQNARNVYYAPGVRYAFRTITFIGGAIELATGSVCQASFLRCAPIRFVQLYLESSPRIPAMIFTDCVGSVDGAYLNGCGGIKVQGNSRLSVHQALAMTPSDVVGTDKDVQYLELNDCSFPASGNTLAAKTVVLRNTTVNGTLHRHDGDSASLGGAWGNRQTTAISAAGLHDVYRFAPVSGKAIEGSVAGRFQVIATDRADPGTQSIYELWLASTGGVGRALLVQLQRVSHGTDAGVSITPFLLAHDADSGGLRLQYHKNPAVQELIVDVVFHGIASAPVT